MWKDSYTNSQVEDFFGHPSNQPILLHLYVEQYSGILIWKLYNENTNSFDHIEISTMICKISIVHVQCSCICKIMLHNISLYSLVVFTKLVKKFIYVKIHRELYWCCAIHRLMTMFLIETTKNDKVDFNKFFSRTRATTLSLTFP